MNQEQTKRSEELRAAEAATSAAKMLRLVMDNIPQGVFWKDRQSRYLGCNEVVARAWGLGSPEAIGGLTDYELPGLTREQADYFIALDREVMEQNQAQYGIIEEATLADGSTIWLETNKIPLLDEAGTVVGVLGTWQDITARRQSEEALRLSEERFRTVVDHAVDGIFIHAMGGKVLDANRAACESLGYTRDELIGKSPLDFDPVITADRIEAMQAPLESGETLTFETLHRRKDGTTFPVEVRLGLLQIGNVPCALSIARDITERKQAEAKLRQREEQLRIFIEHSPVALAMFDREMRYLHASRRWMTDLNLGDRDVRGISHYDVFPEIPERWKEIHRRGLAGEVLRADEDRFERLDGSVQWLRWEIRPWHDESGSVGGIVIFTEEITGRKAAEDALRDSEERYRMLAENAEDMIVLRERGGRTLYRSPSCTRVLGWTDEDENAVDWVKPVHPDDVEKLRQAVATTERGEGATSQFRCLTKGGQYVWLEVRSTPIFDADGQTRRHLIQSRDITERKRSEEILQQREALLRSVTDSAAVGLVMLDRNRRYIFASAAYTRILGLPWNVDNLIGRSPAEVLAPIYSTQIAPQLDQALDGRRVTWELTRPRPGADQSELTHYSVVYDPIRNGIGEVDGIIVTIYDITERKRAEQELAREQAISHSFMESLPGLFFWLDVTGHFIRWNQNVETVTGYSANEIPGMVALDFIADEEKEQVFRSIMQVFEFGTSEVETQIVTRNGRRIPYFFKGVRMMLQDRPYLVGVGVDTTERKQAEVALRESETRLRSVIENSPGVAVQWYDIEGRVVLWNSASEEMFGYSASEAIGRTLDQLIHTPDEYREFLDALAALRTSERSNPPAEYTFRRRNGESGVCLSTVFRIPGPNETDLFVCMDIDITTRKQTETALRESEYRFRQLIDHAPEAVVILDSCIGRFTQANPAAERLFKLSAAELCQVGPTEMSPPLQPDGRPSSEKGHEYVTRALAGETPVFEWTHRDSEGTDILCEVRLLGIVIGGRTVVRGSITDITERKRAEKTLRESEAFLRMTQQVGKVGSWLWDLRTSQMRWSEAMYPIYGLAPGEFDGTLEHAARFIHPDDLPAVQEVIQSILERGEFRPMESRIIRPDGQIAHVWGLGEVIRDASGQPIQCLGTVMDITERKRAEQERIKLEAQMQHAQKLESLGVLAGGIAHDFNNLLTSILGYSELAKLNSVPGSTAERHIDEVVKGTLRAAELTQQMLAYSGKGRFVIQPLNLSAVAAEMGRLLEVSISRKCVLQYHFAPDLPTCEADAAQMRQIIMNLIINASEAIGDRNGVIAVSTGVTHCDRAYLSEAYIDEQLPEGRYVFLEVADSGCGMSAETKAKLFDPFFTTKFTGRGLGLAAVLGIVRGHRGAIKVYSEPDKGTSFKVLFPASADPGQLEPAPRDDAATWRGSGLVLIVDDEESVRESTRAVMELLGFTVLTAADGREGVEVFRKECDRIRLVILDMTMPHLDGEQTFQEIRRIRPGVPTLLCSGYNEQTATNRFVGKGLAGFIQKPSPFQQLVATVRKALDAGSASNPSLPQADRE